MTAAALMVVIFGTIYAVVQQEQRSAANAPQIQLAEDAASALNNGRKPAQLVRSSVEVTNSLDPFVMVYSKSGHLVTSSGSLNHKTPALPVGALKAADGKDYSAVTWQPQAGQRFATVTVAAKDYYVVGVRSLREIEKNESQTLRLAFIGGVAAELVLLASYLTSRRLSRGGVS